MSMLTEEESLQLNVAMETIQNLQKEVSSLQSSNQRPAVRVQTHVNTVNVSKQDAVIFMIEREAAICPNSGRELNFPQNIQFGTVVCKWSFFDSKQSLTDALFKESMGFRALTKEYRFIDACFLLNSVRDRDDIIRAVSDAIPKLATNYYHQIATTVSLPLRQINCIPFLNLRETNPLVGVFDNKNNRSFEQQVDALRGWHNAFIKSIRPASGMVNDVILNNNSSNGGGSMRGRGRGGRGRGGYHRGGY